MCYAENMSARRRWLQQRIISPLVDLSYMLMSVLFAGGFPRWYERLNTWHYRSQAQHYDRSVIEFEGDRYAQALEAGLRALSVHPRTILDVNTGTGFVVQRLLALFPNSKIVATDLSEAMVTQARARYPQIEFLRADTATLPFENESFDLVTLHNGPPHFREMARVVRPGGEILVAFTSGARVPRWLVRRWLRHAQRFGKIETGQAGDGLWLLIQKSTQTTHDA